MAQARRSALLDRSHVLVIDLETTCDEEHTRVNEVIEIGAIMSPMPLDPMTGEQFHFGEFVTPKDNSHVTEYCTQLTTIRQEQVDGGRPFPRVLNELLTKCRRYLGNGNELVFASWGNFDKKVIKAECYRHNVPYPAMFVGHLNLKKWCGIGLERKLGLQTEWDSTTNHEPPDKQYSLQESLNLLDEERSGLPHRALPDARGTWRVFRQLLSAGYM